MRRVATVFGGAGFIGRYVVQRLARLDWIVRVATRSPAATRELATLGKVGQIVPVAVELANDAALARAVAEAELVVNFVGILYEPRPGDFDRLQGELPGRIGAACAAAGVARFLQVSAIGADAASDSRYARSKAAGEAAARAAFPGVTILRPSIVFGPEDNFFNRFAAMAQLLPFMPVVAGDTRFQPVYVGDVADALLAAAERPETAGQVFELGGPRTWSFRELMAFIVEATGRRRRLIDLPPGLVALQARVAERLPRPPLTRDQLKLLERDNVATEGMPGLAALGISPKAVEAIVPGYLVRFRPGGGRRDVVAA